MTLQTLPSVAIRVLCRMSKMHVIITDVSLEIAIAGRPLACQVRSILAPANSDAVKAAELRLSLVFLIQTKTGANICVSQLSEKLPQVKSCCAVSSIGWVPAAMASTTAGARNASGRTRATYRSSVPRRRSLVGMMMVTTSSSACSPERGSQQAGSAALALI